MDWSREFYGNTLIDWGSALATAVITAAVLRVLFGALVRRLGALAGRTETDVDDLVVELLDKTRIVFIGLIVLFLGAWPLTLPDQLDAALRAILYAGLVLQIGFWGMAVINSLVRHYRAREMEDDPGFATAIGAVGFLGRLILWSVLLLTFLKTALNMDISAFVASLGIGGIAVALALQNVLGDLFASLSILLDKPFVIGDFIVVGEMAGTVETVGLKTTRIRSLSGEQLIFSNSDLLASRIRNYKRMEERRVTFSLGVVYGTSSEDLRAIPDLVRRAVESQTNARFDRSHFQGFGDSSLDYETVYYMDVPDYAAYMDTQQAINLALYEEFETRGIEFAYPTRTVFVRYEGEPPQGAEPGSGGPTSPDPAPGSPGPRPD